MRARHIPAPMITKSAVSMMVEEITETEYPDAYYACSSWDKFKGEIMHRMPPAHARLLKVWKAESAEGPNPP